MTAIACSKSSENNAQTESVPILIQISDAHAAPNIARHDADGEADVVVSGDSDFAMCIGCNKNIFDLTIKDVYVNKKDLNIQSAKLVTGQQSVAFWLENVLKTNMEGKLSFPKSLKQRAKKNETNGTKN